MQFRKRSFLLIPCTCLFLLVACKKDEQNIPPPEPVIPKVKTVSAGNDLRTYTYDSKGRVNKLTYNLYGRGEYAYTDNTVVVNFYDTFNVLKYTTTYQLDAHGLAISSSNTVSTTDTYTYAYASDGQPLTSVDTRIIPNDPVRKWTTKSYYTKNILDSVITVMTTDDVFSGNSNTYYDEYFTDKINTLGNINFGQQWLGLSSKNPVKTARDIGHGGDGFYPQTTYTYDYDSQNRITVVHHFYDNSQFPQIFYTYY